MKQPVKMMHRLRYTALCTVVALGLVPVISWAVAVDQPRSSHLSHPVQAGPVQRPAQIVPQCVITPTSIAGIQLGATVKTVKLQHPQATYEQEQSEDGVTYVSVNYNHAPLFWFVPGQTAQTDPEQDDDTLVDTAEIDELDTGSELCQTQEGVHAGMTLDEIAKKLGALVEIQLTEVEGEQYAYFKKQPKTLLIQIDDCGVFNNDQTRTIQYTSDCKARHIRVMPPSD